MVTPLSKRAPTSTRIVFRFFLRRCCVAVATVLLGCQPDPEPRLDADQLLRELEELRTLPQRYDEMLEEHRISGDLDAYDQGQARRSGLLFMGSVLGAVKLATRIENKSEDVITQAYFAGTPEQRLLLLALALNEPPNANERESSGRLLPLLYFVLTCAEDETLRLLAADKLADLDTLPPATCGDCLALALANFATDQPEGPERDWAIVGLERFLTGPCGQTLPGTSAEDELPLSRSLQVRLAFVFFPEILEAELDPATIRVAVERRPADVVMQWWHETGRPLAEARELCR